jgi:Tol biopolymer transport system component
MFIFQSSFLHLLDKAYCTRKFVSFFLILICTVLVACSNHQQNTPAGIQESDFITSTPTSAQEKVPNPEKSITPSRTFTPNSTPIIPDNSLIAFSKGQEIALISPFGGIPTSIISTNERIYYDSPSWSPTGEQIVFTQRGPAIGSKIYLINRDGSGLRLLRDNASDPSWSPDGEHIAFINRFGLFVTNVNGPGLQQLVKSKPSEPASPSWSPDGKKLAFLGDSARFDGPFKIYVIDSDGKNLQPLTKASVGQGRLAWSPDGKTIYFRSYEGCGDINSLDLETGTITNLTNTPDIGDYDSAISADGNFIVFSSAFFYPCKQGEVYAYTGDQLFIMKANGQDASQLLNADGSQPSLWPVTILKAGWKYSITQAGANLNVRELPAKSAKSLATLQKGTVFSVLDGQQNTDGFSWWHIRTDKGIKGWIVDIPGWTMFVSAETINPNK